MVFVVGASKGSVFNGPDFNPIDVVMSWTSEEPLSVLLSADDGLQPPSVWRFARSTLKDGLQRGCLRWKGEGDIAFRAPGAFLTICLRPHHQEPVQIVVHRGAFDQLIADAEHAVPDGSDRKSELVQAAMQRELAIS